MEQLQTFGATGAATNIVPGKRILNRPSLSSLGFRLYLIKVQVELHFCEHFTFKTMSPQDVYLAMKACKFNYTNINGF
jgi:hypothetical protein